MIGDDLPTATLWKALWDAGMYTNVALYPAVPPGGSLIRTSVMATHEREHLDRALEIFAAVRDQLPAAEAVPHKAASKSVRSPDARVR